MGCRDDRDNRPIDLRSFEERKCDEKTAALNDQITELEKRVITLEEHVKLISKALYKFASGDTS